MSQIHTENLLTKLYTDEQQLIELKQQIVSAKKALYNSLRSRKTYYSPENIFLELPPKDNKVTRLHAKVEFINGTTEVSFTPLTYLGDQSNA